MEARNALEFNPIHLLRPRSGSLRLAGVDCLSWRLAAETNNLRHWKLVPASCENYIGNYMLGEQYKNDCKVVADAAIEYAKSLKLAGDGKDVWVFDTDETTVSNLPYYARSDVLFGGRADWGTSTVDYKSKKRTELVNEGYRIVGNIGDQWSDLLGANPGNRTFKMPDPMYYVG
ncbi:hypothetical protein BUALT_Bualt04G0034900 [Buddleja alternifolia]|uniref:Acid phosphatase n=1 Tax=Buddleja alternifolia TaxID=168488 RepID=A0AAV6XKZ2_9LAMI|nr:hypothetical protein BUALT_Bualt04G0034900 [Buddleja alternifolia]